MRVSFYEPVTGGKRVQTRCAAIRISWVFISHNSNNGTHSGRVFQYDWPDYEHAILVRARGGGGGEFIVITVDAAYKTRGHGVRSFVGLKVVRNGPHVSKYFVEKFGLPIRKKKIVEILNFSVKV